jgi:iodotyrosine deiodinase
MYASVPLDFLRLSPDEQRQRAQALFEEARRRRSVRHFSDEPVDLEVVRRCIDVAAQAPSGANKQPWTFVLVTSPELKRRIREAAEREERAFYEERAPTRWLADLEALGVNWEKPFLQTAPALIVVFAQNRGPTPDDRHYYVQESVGIACGFLLLALHQAGLATLTHTPSPMGFLASTLGRPTSERAFVLLPVGYPAAGCEVPAIQRKGRSEYLVEM